MSEPRLPLTVTRKLWDDMAAEVYPEFADSYLSGGKETAATLVPHTVTAYQRIFRNHHAMRVLRGRKLELIEPAPFGHPDRPAGPHLKVVS